MPRMRTPITYCLLVLTILQMGCRLHEKVAAPPRPAPLDVSPVPQSTLARPPATPTLQRLPAAGEFEQSTLQVATAVATGDECCPVSLATASDAVPVSLLDAPGELDDLALDQALQALDTLPAYHELQESCPSPVVDCSCQLTYQECLCSAAQNAIAARLLGIEAEAVECSVCSRRGRRTCIDCIRLDVLKTRSVGQRNLTAGSALKLFFGLLESRHQSVIIERSLAEIDEIESRLQELKRADIKSAVDWGEASRRRAEVLQKREELQLTAAKFDRQLKQLLGIDACCPTLLCPADPLTVEPNCLDAECCVATGLRHRYEVVLLHTLCRGLSDETLETVRQAIAQSNVSLGTFVPTRRLLSIFRRESFSCEIEKRREQLCVLIDESERIVSEEIRQSVLAVETRTRQLAVAKERVATWQTRVNDLTQIIDVELPDSDSKEKPTVFDVSRAKLELLQAESDLLHRLVEWKIAEVELFQAQGLLAEQAGYEFPKLGCCYGQCNCHSLMH
ncbi:MAG: hypothetical protein R3E01_16585 [Pirellulaceae bacterium]|nr:hypothetical protein [Planctomycetales bacterium]